MTTGISNRNNNSELSVFKNPWCGFIILMKNGFILFKFNLTSCIQNNLIIHNKTNLKSTVYHSLKHWFKVVLLAVFNLSSDHVMKKHDQFIKTQFPRQDVKWAPFTARWIHSCYCKIFQRCAAMCIFISLTSNIYLHFCN